MPGPESVRHAILLKLYTLYREGRMTIMLADAVLQQKGMETLIDGLGLIEAERFITLIIRNPFDYTEWRHDQFDGLSVEELSAQAQAYYNTNK
jgi:hypothetical protein